MIVACEKQSFSDSSFESLTVQQHAEDAASKIRVRIKHGGGCNNPLGVCLIIPIGTTNIEAPNDGYPYGTANAQIKETKLQIIFDQQTATNEGIVPITNDIVVYDWLGQKQLIVKAGEYRADFTSHAFGEILTDFEVVN